jgi:hypothetical protein
MCFAARAFFCFCFSSCVQNLRALTRRSKSWCSWLR